MLINVDFSFPEPGKINPVFHVTTREPYVDGLAPINAAATHRTAVKIDESDLDSAPLSEDERATVVEAIATAVSDRIVWQVD